MAERLCLCVPERGMTVQLHAKKLRDFRHLLKNLSYKLLLSTLATLGWYSCRSRRYLFNYFFYFFFSLPWSTNAEILPKVEIFSREAEKATISNFYRRFSLLCAFSFPFSGDAFFQFLCRKKCCVSTFLTSFSSSFLVLLHSPAVLSTCVSVVTGVKADIEKGPNDKQIRIKIVIFFCGCIKKMIELIVDMCVEIKSKEGV